MTSTLKTDVLESKTTNGALTIQGNGTGNVVIVSTASATPAANGDIVVEATSNTTLTFKLKGSDGTVRSGTVTLS
ncbi:hypothetical protein N9937_02135 [bacterium]|nr:hypothetical protein [bacterium]